LKKEHWAEMRFIYHFSFSVSNTRVGKVFKVFDLSDREKSVPGRFDSLPFHQLAT